MYTIFATPGKHHDAIIIFRRKSDHQVVHKAGLFLDEYVLPLNLKKGYQKEIDPELLAQVLLDSNSRVTESTALLVDDAIRHKRNLMAPKLIKQQNTYEQCLFEE